MQRRKKMKINLKNKKPIIIIGAIIAVVALLFVILNQFYIDIMWFSEVEYLQVFFKGIVTKLTLGVPIFVVLMIILSVYYKILSKTSTKNGVAVIDNESFVKRKLPFILSFVVSVFLSIQLTQSLWYKWLEFSNSVDFGKLDPIFSKDISFYVFKLPFYESLVNVGYTIIIVLAISTIAYSLFALLHTTNNNKRINPMPETPEAKIDDAKELISNIWNNFRIQLSFFVGAGFILYAISSWLRRYNVLYSSNGVAFGASYTDVNIMVPFFFILIILSVIAAVSSIIFGLKKKLKPLGITIAAMIIVNLIGGGVAGIVDALVVAPNEYSKESPYIEHNIEFTRAAYDLDKIEVKEFPANEPITKEDIIKNETTINNIPVNDYTPTLDTYNSLQGIRPYYQFNDIDVDRYTLDGEYTQVFISPREMNTNLLDTSAQNWINTHLKYTHGFGATVSPVNEVTSTGQPVMISKDIPATSEYEELQLDQPRIYFGEMEDSYAVVNTKAKEFDYPEGSANVENVYDGEAGIPLNFLNKLSFALDKGTLKFLLSTDITSESKILINRNVYDRVKKIAPFLSYDVDPYAVIIDGKLYWMMDAMTKTNLYPYSQPYSAQENYNYIRNSVKVVVDAYTGEVTFYIVDENDAIAQVYSEIYPDLFRSFDEMPQGFKDHLRYPEQLFDIQAKMYNTYHIENTGVFYNKEDVWSIANQYYGTEETAVKVNSAYMIMKLPEREEEFLLMVPFTPPNKDNMVAWMAGICDGDEYGTLIVYQFPKQSLVYGPMQIEKRINQDTIISQQLTLLGQQGSQILRGNLQTIPIDGGLLYMEALYIKASGEGKSLPEAKKVIVSYGDKIVMADSLNLALMQIFDLDEDDLKAPLDPGTSPEINPDNPNPPILTPADLINQANDLFTKANDAAKNGDWASYGKYMDELGIVLNSLK